VSRTLLQIEGLEVSFGAEGGRVRAVRGLDLTVASGETLALVGESGCGKSVTALSILRLIPDPPGRIDAGTILFGDDDAGDGEPDEELLGVSEERIRQVRGNEIAMIFQEPMTSLNPVFTVGDQIVEAIELHREERGKAARQRAVEMLRRVGMPAPEQRVKEHPHQLSGGMRQRVMIAMALSCDPTLLIADEPTTALDVTIQAQILELLRSLQEDVGMSILLITHDLGIVAETAHRVAVMYAGRIVEEAPVEALFANPRHPYTAGLLRSLPRLDGRHAALVPIEGNVPDPGSLGEGCAFAPRCPLVTDRCRREEPPMEADRDGRRFACFVTGVDPGRSLLAEGPA
jgi:oligopeptide transport system ATP-binding protein